MSPPIIAVSKKLNESPKDATQFDPKSLAEMLEADAQLTWYENIPDETPIKMYLDFDCKDVEVEDFEVKKKEVMEDAIKHIEIVIGRPVTKENTLWAESCGEKDGKMKVSYHAILQDYKTTKATNKKVAEKMVASGSKYTDIQPYGSGSCGIQKMRLVGCVKAPNDLRKMNKIGDYDITKSFITIVDETAQEFKLPEDDWFLAKAEESMKKKDYEKVDGSLIKDLIPDLKVLGFTNIQPIGDTYNFMCDQRDGKTKCPLCPHTHKNNQYRIRFDGCAYHVKNHSQKCKETPVKQIVEFNENQEKGEYLAMKQHFEGHKNVAKILKPTPMYVYDADDTLVNKQHLTEVFEDYVMSHTSPKGEPIPFTREWYRDPNKRVFEKIDFCPFSNDENTAEPTIYNMFKGFRAGKLNYDISLEEREERVKPFLTLLQNNTASGGYEYALNWCANMLQNPETDKRAKIALVFQGEERGGKTELINFLGKSVIGNDMYGYTHDPDRDVFSAYPTFLSKRILCVIDEADCYKHEKKLFGYITAPEVIHRPMYVGAMNITATHNLVFTSNLPKQVRIAKDGGKFACFKTDNTLNPILAEDKQKARDFWDHWWNVWKKDDRNAKAVYDYLMNHKIPENYDWVNERPTDSETHQDMRLSDLSPVLKFVEHFITSAYPSHLKQHPEDNTTFEEKINVTTTKVKKRYDKIKGYDMFELFKAYYPRYSKYDMDAQGFACKLVSELKKEGVLSVDKQEALAFHKFKSGSIYWKFNREQAFAWLKRRQFTTHDELPTETMSYRLEENGNFSYYDIEKTMRETLG